MTCNKTSVTVHQLIVSPLVDCSWIFLTCQICCLKCCVIKLKQVIKSFVISEKVENYFVILNFNMFHCLSIFCRTTSHLDVNKDKNVVYQLISL